MRNQNFTIEVQAEVESGIVYNFERKKSKFMLSSSQSENIGHCYLRFYNKGGDKRNFFFRFIQKIITKICWLIEKRCNLV